MDKVLFTENTKINLPVFLSDLQDYIYQGTLDRFGMWYDSYGVNAKFNPSGVIRSDDTSFKVIQSGVTLYVYPGNALTDDGYFLMNNSAQSVNYAGLTNGTHSLSVVYSGILSNPVYVRNGFVYSEMAGFSTVPTRRHDSVRFIWDLSPVNSGIVLANVGISAGSLTSVTDRRNESILYISDPTIPVGLLMTDNPEGQVVGPLFLPSLMVSGILPGSISFNPGTSGTQFYSTDDFYSDTQIMHPQNTDTSTTSLNFMVGQGKLGKTGLGNPVRTLEDPPPAPGNFRIINIDKVTTVDGKGTYYNDVSVHLKWNWDNVIGQGRYIEADHDDPSKRATQFVLSGVVVEENDLNNFFLTSTKTTHGTGFVAHIFRNEATLGGRTILYLDWFYEPILLGILDFNSDRVAFMEAIKIDETCDGRVQCWADRFEILSIPIDEHGNEAGESTLTEYVAYGSQDITSIQDDYELYLPIGMHYNIFVRAYWNQKYSAYSKLGSGTVTKSMALLGNKNLYDPYPIPYDSPFLAKIPTLNWQDVTLTATSTDNGFRAVINDQGLWDSASAYEFVYARQAADFNNPLHSHYLSYDKTFDFTSSDGLVSYNIKARPLFGQQTGTVGYAETTVDSGFNGLLPNEKQLATIKINKKTYSGTITVGSPYLTLSDPTYSPCAASPSSHEVDLDSRALGVDDSADIIIATTTGAQYAPLGYAGYSGGYRFTYKKMNGFSDPGAGTGYTVNYSTDATTCKAARYLGTITLQGNTNYAITKVSGDCDNLEGGTKATVRIYQQGREDIIEHITIGGTGSFAQRLNLSLLKTNGASVLAVDLYDDATSNAINYTSCVGSITIYGKPLVN